MRSVAETRRALNLTQEDVADRVGFSTEFYSRIERGRAIPSVQTLVKMSDALGVTPDVLLGFQQAGDPNPSAAPDDPADVRRTIRRLRVASPSTLRFVNALLNELDRIEGRPEDSVP